MSNANQVENLRRVETGISRHLFFICSFVTLATMIVMVVDFLGRGSFVSPKMDLFYLAVLAIYSVHKELLRWLGEKRIRREGEYFVYAWVLLTTVLYVVNFFSRDYFSYSREGYSIGTLRDVSLLTVEVLAVFILTRVLKLLAVFTKVEKGL